MDSDCSVTLIQPVRVFEIRGTLSRGDMEEKSAYWANQKVGGATCSATSIKLDNVFTTKAGLIQGPYQGSCHS